MDHRKALLIASAARLYSVGIDLEAARARLSELAERGVSYSSEEMLKAYAEYMELNTRWKALEQQHLELRDEIVRDETSRNG